MKWSSFIASVGLVVVALGIGFVLAPYVFPACSATPPRSCASSLGPAGEGIEIVLVGVGVVGLAIIAAIQELQDALAGTSPKREIP